MKYFDILPEPKAIAEQINNWVNSETAKLVSDVGKKIKVSVHSKAKIFDIAPAHSKWARQYAHLEYRRIVWHDLWEATTYIEVSYV